MHTIKTLFIFYCYRNVGPIVGFLEKAVNWAQSLLLPKSDSQVNPLSIGDSVPLRDCPPGETRSAIRNECRRPLTPG